MRAVIQRTSEASVQTENGHKEHIRNGLLIFLGIETEDDISDVLWLSKKISNLRIFDDDQGIMNLSVKNIGGEIMIISQFTLHASTKKGNRPSYIRAARPEMAMNLYEKFLKQMAIDSGSAIKNGSFGEYMDVALVNDGPVTIIIDTKNRE